MSPTRPELSGSFGMVAASHWLAAATGMGILERGGNAFDAAVATGLVLQVVEPHLNGPGGEVPILVHSADTGGVEVICGQGPLPAAASVAGMLDLGLSQVPGTGLLAACVPGAFGAWMTLLEARGSMDIEEVMAPAIGYARTGFRLLPTAAATIARNEELFRRYWPTSAEIYLPGGAAPLGGSWFANPTLAGTYERILDQARSAAGGREARIRAAGDAFYRGFVAEAIGAYLARAEVADDSGRPHRGLLDADDLARWEPGLEAPVAIDYADLRVHKTGPWGQGPVFLQQLRMLAGFDLTSLAPDSPEWVHIITEVAKLAFADRDAFYGDPSHVSVPIEELLSAEYASQRSLLVGHEASADQRPGSPGGSLPWIPAPELLSFPEERLAGGGAPPDPIGRDTCQLDVVDRHGNMVAATPSGGWLHGSPCIPTLGFPLGTRGQMCWLDESAPAAFVGGRRPRTTLSPTLVLGRPGQALGFGTPGGDQQDQWTLGFFLRRVHHQMDLQSAIDAPSSHTSHLMGSFHPRRSYPGRLHLEARFPDATVDDLARRAHDVVLEGPWSLGRVCAVGRDGQELTAGADPRQDQAYAVGR
jgi:gamma-glutamyltranspeptidase/glutathione hydrolase